MILLKLKKGNPGSSMDVEEEEEGSRGASSVPVSSHGEDDDIEEEYFHP